MEKCHGTLLAVQKNTIAESGSRTNNPRKRQVSRERQHNTRNERLQKKRENQTQKNLLASLDEIGLNKREATGEPFEDKKHAPIDRNQ